MGVLGWGWGWGVVGGWGLGLGLGLGLVKCQTGVIPKGGPRERDQPRARGLLCRVRVEGLGLGLMYGGQGESAWV